jgi:uncharacterized membrane protein YoaK (UPF0700 family)
MTFSEFFKRLLKDFYHWLFSASFWVLMFVCICVLGAFYAYESDMEGASAVLACISLIFFMMLPGAEGHR